MAGSNDKRHKNSGRKNDQKMKAFLIYFYLMRETDAEHLAPIEDIKDYLEKHGIEAESRSIYRDIRELNRALLAMEKEITLDEADALIAEDEEKRYIRHRKRVGFYVARRRYEKATYEEEDIRMLAECVLAAKFLDEKSAAQLIDIVYGMVSVFQAENMSHKAIVKDRVRTINKEVYYTVTRINDAIGQGGIHAKRIRFQYLKYTLQDLQTQSPRRNGEEYTVVPCSLVLDNGNYYLLAYNIPTADEDEPELATYRVDRMKLLEVMDGLNFVYSRFNDRDMEQYTQGHFGMFDGRYEHVTLSCSIRVLDAIVDRFGREGVVYTHGINNGFFQVQVPVYVSKLFFGWLAGYGKLVQILKPSSVRREYTNYLKEIYEWNTHSSLK